MPKALTPLLLGNVCRVWRQIAWTTPQIWASITINVSYHSFSTLQTELANQWLRRAGELPLTIKIRTLNLNTAVDQYAPSPSSIYELINILNAYSRRWWKLDVAMPMQYLTYFARHPAPETTYSPVLNSLVLLPILGVGNDFPNVPFNAADHPFSPKYVKLSNLHVMKIRIDWKNVTTIVAGSISISYCLEIIRQCPQLTICEFDTAEDDLEFFMKPPGAPFIHHALQTLKYQDSESVGLELFLDNVAFPVLELFDYKRNGVGSLHLASSHVLGRSNCPIKSFSLQDIRLVDGDIIQLLELVPHLESLVLGLQFRSGRTPGL
ncbi:hypothetical protein BDZ97DRAFT_1762338 [Flammula alnicola]|nr:hypothetical protein BDZ97DRAFT_1762338 [Flammula alnicola]